MKMSRSAMRLFIAFCFVLAGATLAPQVQADTTSSKSSKLIQKLEGKWICDGKATLALTDPDLTLQEKKTVIDALNKIIFRFNVDASTMTCTVPTGSQTLNYKIVSETENTITLKTGSNIVITFQTDGSILLNDGAAGSKGAILRKI